MRESNFISVTGNRAALSISPVLYDRRALDCTADRPLVNSLKHLLRLVGQTRKVRDSLCNDGGLERVVEILNGCRDENAYFGDVALVTWKWELSFQILKYLGTRGDENVKKRVVEAGGMSVAATVLHNYLNLASGPRALSRVDSAAPSLASSISSIASATGSIADNSNGSSLSQSSSANTNTFAQNVLSRSTLYSQASHAVFHTVVNSTQNGTETTRNDTVLTQTRALQNSPSFSSEVNMESLPERAMALESGVGSIVKKREFVQHVIKPTEKDVIWALEMIAYCVKHSELKRRFQHSTLFQNIALSDGAVDSDMGDAYNEKEYDYDQYDFEDEEFDLHIDYQCGLVDVFGLVEQLTHRSFSRDVTYWAGVAMRNFCRRDANHITQCGNLACGKLESCPREFAKCRRCKITKYCGRECQLVAWRMHKYWCVSSNAATASSASSQTSNVNSANNGAETNEVGEDTGRRASNMMVHQATTVSR